MGREKTGGVEEGVGARKKEEGLKRNSNSRYGGEGGKGRERQR